LPFSNSLKVRGRRRKEEESRRKEEEGGGRRRNEEERGMRDQENTEMEKNFLEFTLH
jgi:hypothetical protein